MASKYAELNATKSAAEKEMKSIRQELIDFTGLTFKGRSDHFDLTVSTVDGGMTVDSNLLRQQHPQIYDEVLKPRSGYSRLEVKPRKRPQLAKAA